MRAEEQNAQRDRQNVSDDRAAFEPGRAHSEDDQDDAQDAVGKQPDRQHLPRAIVLDVVRSRGEERQDGEQ